MPRRGGCGTQLYLLVVARQFRMDVGLCHTLRAGGGRSSDVRAEVAAERISFRRDRALEPDLARGDNQQLAKSIRSEEHTSELQSLMRISYAVFCLKKKTRNINH